MPPRKRRSYTAEYKVEAAHRVIDSGRTISEVARELGIDAGMLSVWVKDERRRTAAVEAHGDAALDAGERAELQRLRRQVGELEKDNAFLVKASAYFAAMQKNRPGSL
ncbi:transposase [Actinosynnema sp. ALI-1.44]|uniref:transposase n=1 Tax=Actinosynnema sp. ALI-1.44 TaxID=1933779 RepID=UPI00097C807D|nr:transposase [Actinosynnema sp. ALI-1.44]ONI88295.1 transposase [Actinosynnema sp. ALI-1.44]